MGERLPLIDCADWEWEKRRERGADEGDRGEQSMQLCAVVDTRPGSICPCYRDRYWGQKKFANWTCAAMPCLNMSYTWVEALCGHTGCTCTGLGLGPAVSHVRHIPVRMTVGWRRWLWYLRMADSRPIDLLSDNSRFAPLTWSTPFAFQNMMHIVFFVEVKPFKIWMTIYKKYQHLQYHMHTQYECSNDIDLRL
jgi:hypothetical protein